MTLLFRSSNGKERVIGNPNTLEEATKIINHFLDDHNFKSYYTRIWFENGRLKYDVGSHTEFFYLDEFTEESLENLKERGLTP